MPDFSNQPLFNTKGTRVTGAGCVILVLAAVIAVTLLIVSIAAPHRVGEWWMWTAVLATIIGLSVVLYYRDGFELYLFKADANTFHIKTQGPGAELDFQFTRAQLHYWYAYEITSNNSAIVIYFCAIADGKGGTVLFKEMIGRKGTEPADWKHEYQQPTEGAGMYHLSKLRDFVKAVGRN